MGAGVTSHQGEPPTYEGNGAGAKLSRSPRLGTPGGTGGTRVQVDPPVAKVGEMRADGIRRRS